MKRYLIIAGVNGAGKTTLYSTEDNYSESMHNLKYVLTQCNMATIFDNTTKLTRIATFKKGKCEWKAKMLPQWYKQLDL